MKKPMIPKWLHTLFLIASLGLIAWGITAWSLEYRIQSATLFGFAIFFALQWGTTAPRKSA